MGEPATGPEGCDRARQPLAASARLRLELAALALKRSALALAYRRLPLTRLEGRLADGTPAKLVLAGTSPALTALTERLMPQVNESCPLRDCPLATLPWRVGGLTAAYDLVAARVERGASAVIGRGALRVPELVDAVLTVPRPGEPLRLSHSARSSVAQVRKVGLGYSISHAEGDLDLFVQRYYRPHVAAAYGERAAPRALRTLRAAVLRGSILWVERGHERLAGALVSVEDGELILVALGVRDGDLSLRRLGASTACVLFGLEHAGRLGLRRLDVGGSLAWLADPVLQAKRFLGVRLRPRRRATHDLLLWWRGSSVAAASLVRGLAPIHRAGSGALVALTDGDPHGLERLRLPGLAVSHAAFPAGGCRTPSSRAVVDTIRQELADSGPARTASARSVAAPL